MVFRAYGRDGTLATDITLLLFLWLLGNFDRPAMQSMQVVICTRSRDRQGGVGTSYAFGKMCGHEGAAGAQEIARVTALQSGRCLI